MKKIAAVFDGLKFEESTLQYTLALAKQENAHITGIFPDDFTYNSFSLPDLIASGAKPGQIEQLEQADRKKRDAAVQSFEQTVADAGLHFSLHRENNIAIQDVLHESIYADLLIVNNAEAFRKGEHERPTHFIRSLLTEVQCPVLLTPTNYLPIKKVVLLYDGEPSSVYAIKMCGYLLSWIGSLPVEVVSVNEPENGLHLNEERLMKEFMDRHFPHATYTVLKGQAEDKIIEHLQSQQGDTLTVLGAYRRGAVSRWFRQSMADVLISKLQLPLFIAHNK